MSWISWQALADIFCQKGLIIIFAAKITYLDKNDIINSFININLAKCVHTFWSTQSNTIFKIYKSATFIILKLIHSCVTGSSGKGDTSTCQKISFMHFSKTSTEKEPKLWKLQRCQNNMHLYLSAIQFHLHAFIILQSNEQLNTHVSDESIISTCWNSCSLCKKDLFACV